MDISTATCGFGPWSSKVAAMEFWSTLRMKENYMTQWTQNNLDLNELCQNLVHRKLKGKCTILLLLLPKDLGLCEEVKAKLLPLKLNLRAKTNSDKILAFLCCLHFSYIKIWCNFFTHSTLSLIFTLQIIEGKSIAFMFLNAHLHFFQGLSVSRLPYKAMRKGSYPQ